MYLFVRLISRSRQLAQGNMWVFAASVLSEEINQEGEEEGRKAGAQTGLGQCDYLNDNTMVDDCHSSFVKTH